MKPYKFIDPLPVLPLDDAVIQNLVLADPCVRSLAFVIPDESGGPGTQVLITEEAGNLVLTVDVLDTSLITADLRGLFFHIDETLLPGLSIITTDPRITQTRIGLNNVINLGNGANMNGAVKTGFDIGIEFGRQGIGKGDDVNSPVSFTLDATQDLTLEALTYKLFGVRLTSIGMPGGQREDSAKNLLVTSAPPDAIDDAYQIFEDGAAGLAAPSHTPSAAQLFVLANDTDADGDPLSITAFDDTPDHGAVTIAADGKSVLYTPVADYAGTDSFVYCISDGNGGTDFATVNVVIAAVADVPDIDVQVLAGAAVNAITLIVTATQSDADSSEYIDRILASSIPSGVTLTPAAVNPGSEPDQIVTEYLLTLPLDADTAFDLTFTAVAKETSNGDEQTASETVNIVYEYNSTTTDVEFTAADQSIWRNGSQYTLSDSRFLGIDTGAFDKRLTALGGTVYAGLKGDIQLGFQSTLNFEGGQIDATSNYDVTIETNYNKTTDLLRIDTGALLVASTFDTTGPHGTYKLDFIWDLFLQAYAGIDIDFGSIDFDILDLIPGDQTLDFGGIHEQGNLPGVDFGPGSLNLLDLDSDTFAGEIAFPSPLEAFQINYDWPDIDTSGAYPPNPFPGHAESGNILELDLDVDQLAAQIISYVLGLPTTINPLHPVDLDLGIAFADFDLLDIDVIGGINLLQDFMLQMGQLTGILMFENGSVQNFAIGNSLLLSDASAIDAGGDGDGLVEFNFGLVPTSTLKNVTTLGLNIGYDIDLFEVAVGYDVSVYNPFSLLGLGDEYYYFEDNIGVGPLAGFGGSTSIGEVNIYDETFSLTFGQGQVWALA